MSMFHIYILKWILDDCLNFSSVCGLQQELPWRFKPCMEAIQLFVHACVV
jgi:hypothetical protein